MLEKVNETLMYDSKDAPHFIRSQMGANMQPIENEISPEDTD